MASMPPPARPSASTTHHPATPPCSDGPRPVATSSPSRPAAAKSARPLPLASRAGLPPPRPPPRGVRHSPRASGQWAKTDRLDARLIAAYAAAIPGDFHQPDPEAAQLAELVTYRPQLIDIETTRPNQAEHLPDPELRLFF